MVIHQIEALVKCGVDHVVLAVNYRAEIMEREMASHAERLGIKITMSLETEPLGTGTLRCPRVRVSSSVSVCAVGSAQCVVRRASCVVRSAL